MDRLTDGQTFASGGITSLHTLHSQVIDGGTNQSHLQWDQEMALYAHDVTVKLRMTSQLKKCYNVGGAECRYIRSKQLSFDSMILKLLESN